MDFSKLDSLIASQHPSYPSAPTYLASLGTPSLSIAVLEDGKISSHMITSTESDDVDTLFQAGSISKSISALGVMKLVESGKINLEDPITKYLSNEIIDSIAGDEATKALMEYITIELLLSHRGGLGIHGFDGYHPVSTGECAIGSENALGNGAIAANNIPSTADIIFGRRGVNSLRVGIETFPGQKFSYSGGGYTVLQLIMETVCGKDFATLMKELVLDPLGMSQSTFLPPRKWERGVKRSKAYSTGYTPAVVEYHELPELAAAGLWTTPSELVKAVKEIQVSLENENGGFMSQEMAQRMLTPAEEGGEVTLGWRVDDYGFGHSGSNNPGWISSLWAAADLSFIKKNEEKEGKQGNGKKENGEKNEEEEKEKEEERQLRKRKMKGISGRAACIMTNSAVGYYAVMMVNPALAYVGGWPVVPIMHGGPQDTVPFAARDILIDHSWKEWIGKWGEKEEWAIEEKAGLPQLRFKELPLIKLVPGARPVHEYSRSKKAVDLVIDGLGMGSLVRLGWNKEDRVIEIWKSWAKEVLEKKKEKGADAGKTKEDN